MNQRFRRFAAALVAAAALAAAFACAGKPVVNFAYDHAASFGGIKTYAWFDDPNFQMPGGNSIVDGKFIDDNVRRAIDETMKKKGVQPAPAGAKPDIFVS